MLLLSFFRSDPRRARRLLAMMLLAATTAALAAPHASALGSYAVQACTDGDAVLPVSDPFGGWAGETNRLDGSHRVENDCASGLGLLMQLKGTDRKAAGDYAAWKFTAPTNTRLTDAVISYDSYTRPFNGHTQGAFTVTASGVTGALTSHQGAGFLDGRVLEYHGLSGRWLRVAVSCDSIDMSDCPTGEDATAMLHRSVMTLADDVEPMVTSTSGSAFADARWEGSEVAAYSASDLGAGLAEFRLYVDGQEQYSRIPNDNGGKCDLSRESDGLPLFDTPKPCPQSVTASETIDTTTIPDGSHEVDLVVADASGRETSMASGTKIVANHPPVNLSPPAFVDGTRAAQPHVGDVLQAVRGSWSGPDLTYAVAWERCEADGSACGQIPGAFSDTYTLTSADLGRRVRVAVTATNLADSVTSRTALTGTVATLSAPMDDTTTTSSSSGTTSVAPTLSSGSPSTGSTAGADPEPDHALVGHVAGEPPTATCPQDRAALVLQGVAGRTVKLPYGRRGSVRVALTCAATGKAIANARLDVATRVGSRPAVASQLTTDGSGHATLALPRGASRAITVGYRMYADDPVARATVTVRVRVGGRLSLRASRRTLRNRQTVTLTGALAGGFVPRRGVDLAVQWRDGRRWRTFALARTDRRGRFHYAYRFTRTRGTVRYTLRVQVLKGQVDYPFEPVASKAVRLTVRGS